MSLPSSAHRSFLVTFVAGTDPDDWIKSKHLARFLQGTTDKAAETSNDWGHICAVNAISDATRRRDAAARRKAEEEAKHHDEIAELRYQIRLREEFRTIEARIRNSEPNGFWQRKIDILWAYLTEDRYLTDLAASFSLTEDSINKEAQRGRVLFVKHGASEDLMKAIGR
jgi:hypothetical protein